MRTPYVPTPAATPLNHYQACVKEIYTLKTNEEFDEFIENYLPEYPLNATQMRTIMEVVITGQRRLMNSRNGTPVTATTTPVENPNPSKEKDSSFSEGIIDSWRNRVEAIAEEYKEVDAENFPPIDIQVSGTDIDPLDMIPASKPTLAESVTEIETVFPESNKPTNNIMNEEVKQKRTRKTKEEVQLEQVQTVNKNWSTITLKRRINLPIEWVEYSNNEYGCEVTASTKEEAQDLLEEIMADFIQSSGLVRSSSIEAQKKASYDQGFQAGIKSVPPAPPVVQNVRSPEDDLEIRRYIRLQKFIKALSENSSIRPSMDAIAAEFTKTNPKF